MSADVSIASVAGFALDVFLAEDSIWLAMVSLLHTFTISKPVDADAELSSIQWSSGLVR